MKTALLPLLLLLVLGSSCIKIVRQGEVGVKRKLGKLSERQYPSGAYLINPFTTRIIKVPTRTINLAVSLESLPSKEGLNVKAEFSVLFHIRAESATEVVRSIGVREGEEIIRNVLRSAAANVTSKHNAKDLHTSERDLIGKDIAEHMTNLLGDRGLVVEAILLKGIYLPDGLYQAIEEKMRAEQDAQRMVYVLEKEAKEAERKKIEAGGIRDAQKIIAEGLSDMVIKYQSIDAFKELSKSPASKVIITDGNAPLLIDTK